MVIADSCITSMAGADIIEAVVIRITMTTGILDEDAAALTVTKMTIISDADIVDLMITEVAANAVIVVIIEGVTGAIAGIICIVISLVNSHGNTNVSTVCRGDFYPSGSLNPVIKMVGTSPVRMRINGVTRAAGGLRVRNEV